MNASVPTPDDSALDQAAAEWLCEREEGFTPGRARAFAAWCACDPRHPAAIRRMERTLELLDEMPAVRPRLEERFPHPRAPRAPAEGGAIVAFHRLARTGGIAAALLLGLAAWWWSAGPRPSPSQHYTTDEIAQRSVALADGSLMDVNVDSDVVVQYTPRERRVLLHEGEAHFQVTHDPARPFIVTAGDVSVRAVGTMFDVRLTAEAVDVVVVEGRVEVTRRAAGPVRVTAGPAPLLRAGERAKMIRDAVDAAPQIQAIDAGSIRSLLTWQTPMTSFTDVPLRDVVTRFNRRNVTQLVLEDAELGTRTIGGKFALDQVDAFVRLLEQDGDIVVDRITPGQIALRRAH